MEQQLEELDNYNSDNAGINMVPAVSENDCASAGGITKRKGLRSSAIMFASKVDNESKVWKL